MLSPTCALCSTSDIVPELHYNSHKVCLFQNWWHLQRCCHFALFHWEVQVLVKIEIVHPHTCSTQMSIIVASAYMFDRKLFILMCMFGREQTLVVAPPESSCVCKRKKKKKWNKNMTCLFTSMYEVNSVSGQEIFASFYLSAETRKPANTMVPICRSIFLQQNTGLKTWTSALKPLQMFNY